jgi:hypothetical protein
MIFPESLARSLPQGTAPKRIKPSQIAIVATMGNGEIKLSDQTIQGSAAKICGPIKDFWPLGKKILCH